MADTRIKIPDGELLDALKQQDATDTRIKVPEGEILDAIKAISGGGGTPPDLSSYEKKADHTTDITNLQNTKQDKGNYALKTDIPDISGKADKSYVDTQDTTTLNNAKVYTNQQVKIPNDKNTEQDTRLTNDEANINNLTTNKADKTYVDSQDNGLATKHQSDFNILQTQIGDKQSQLIQGNGIKITSQTISVDPTVVTVWKPVTITQPTNRVANFTIVTGIYRIGFTFDQPTEVNYQYVTYRVVNVAGQNNEILTFYRDSGVAGAIPNVLALRCVPAGFEIYDKYGTSSGYGAIMRVDIQATT